MPRHQASFGIDSKTDAHTARLVVDRMYDSFREELRGTESGEPQLNETLQEFEAIRRAVREQSRGTLTLVYEQTDGEFDD